MGWFAFAVAVAASFFIWWQLWRRWIQPTRDLQALIEEVTAEKMPRTFLIGEALVCADSRLHSNNLPCREAQLRDASPGRRVRGAGNRRRARRWVWSSRTGSGAFA